MKREEILSAAAEVITGDRHRDYGNARDNFTRIGRLWEPILGVSVSAEQFALCMIAVKMGRLTHTPNHLDSWMDICGYAALAGESDP